MSAYVVSDRTLSAYESRLYRSLQGLKTCILKRLIKEKGQEIEWGI